MIKASPTEYKRIKMRSKSEAIFARCLDLTCGSGSENEPSFIYEPNTINNQFSLGRSWDFLVFRELNGMRVAILIELKPSLPTDTYVEQIRGIASTEVKRFSSSKISEECEIIVVLIHGSAWSKNEVPYTIEVLASSVALSGRLKSISNWLGITRQTVASAIAYRFDLFAQASTSFQKKQVAPLVLSSASSFQTRHEEEICVHKLKHPGIYHATVVIVHIEKHYEDGDEYPLPYGFSVGLEVLAGPHSGGNFQLVFCGPRLDQPDNSEHNKLTASRQSAFYLACDLLTPEQAFDFCYQGCIEFDQIDLLDAIGSQIIIEIEVETYETQSGKKRKRLSLVGDNVYHVDDPRFSCVDIDTNLLAVIPAENRHKPEYFCVV
jgi:hypothetical protein